MTIQAVAIITILPIFYHTFVSLISGTTYTLRTSHNESVKGLYPQDFRHLTISALLKTCRKITPSIIFFQSYDNAWPLLNSRKSLSIVGAGKYPNISLWLCSFYFPIQNNLPGRLRDAKMVFPPLPKIHRISRRGQALLYLRRISKLGWENYFSFKKLQVSHMAKLWALEPVRLYLK